MLCSSQLLTPLLNATELYSQPCRIPVPSLTTSKPIQKPRRCRHCRKDQATRTPSVMASYSHQRMILCLIHCHEVVLLLDQKKIRCNSDSVGTTPCEEDNANVPERRLSAGTAREPIRGPPASCRNSNDPDGQGCNSSNEISPRGGGAWAEPGCRNDAPRQHS